MAHPDTDALIEKIETMLEERGVCDWVLALNATDSDVDLARFEGSVYWRMGACSDIIASVKHDRKLQRMAADIERDESDGGT